jgi:hypothetical protein
MTVERRYYACRACGTTQTPWDAWAGVGGGGTQVTDHARRVIATVATAWSFDRASAKLKDVCAITVSDDTVERVCQDEGERARRWLRGDCEAGGGGGELAGAFAAAGGDPEFYADGLKVNTTGGWREMRLNLLQKRERAAPATPAQWRDRVLPEARVRVAGCAIADARLTGAMWARWGAAFGLADARDLSVLADGAAWIWDQAAARLSPHAQWCVDVYHVSEHVHACGRAMFGDGTDAARAWSEQRLEELIARGGPAAVASLDELIAACAAADPGGGGGGGGGGHRAAALAALRTYLDGNRDRMWYADRLRDGRPIGSGAIEGACKQVGGRMTLNGARWRVRRAERFGALLCLEYAGQTDLYWSSRAA